MRHRWILASLSLHLALCALAARASRRPLPPAAPVARVEVVELDLTAPPPESEGSVRASAPAATSMHIARRAHPPMVARPTRDAPTPATPTTSPVTAAPTPAPTPARNPLPTGLFARLTQDADAAWGALHGDDPAPRPPAREALWTGTRGDPETRLRDQSAGYIGRALAAGEHTSPPGLRAYYWDLRRRLQETWRPSGAPEPTVMRAIVSDAFSSPEATQRVMDRAVGPRFLPRQYAAGEAMEAAHPNAGNGGPLVTVSPGIADRAEATARTTGAEIELDQDALGAITALRVVRPSHVAGFDREAERAVRAAVPLLGPFPRVGGRRSRWRFEVVTTRDPISPLRPDGAVIELGMEFDETTGWTELHWPGRPHARSRIVLLSESPRPS